MSTTQPGWYPDAQHVGGLRWWDGAQWTEHRSPAPAFNPYTAQAQATPYSSTQAQSAPYSTATYGELKAPEGTDGNTVWVWLVILVPMLPVFTLLLDDWSRTFDLNDPLAGVRYMLTPGYLIATLAGWLTYGLSVWFSYLDYRELGVRQVPRLFHWAWAFLSSAVYAIGRSVVVTRRTGRGRAPMWVQIIMLLVTVGVVVYITFAVMIGVINSLPPSLLR